MRRRAMPKHIKVELDFIPVEERLPEAGYIAFTIRGAIPITAGYVTTDGVWMHGHFANCSIGTVTHWAEIPKI